MQRFAAQKKSSLTARKKLRSAAAEVSSCVSRIGLNKLCQYFFFSIIGTPKHFRAF